MRDTRKSFVAALRKAVKDWDHAEVQRLIDERVDEATDTMDCQKIAEHWREGDTGEMRVGHGEEVGECEYGCPIDALDRAGLIKVQVFARCPKGHDWHGVCPVCAGERDE